MNNKILLTKLVNLAGKKIRKWTVLERDMLRKNGTFWICRCECGAIKSINAGSLKNPQGTSRCRSCAYWKGCGDISLDFYTSIKRVAMKRRLEFDVDLEFLWELFLKQNKKCALSGVSLSFIRNRHTCSSKDQTASLDRIDSSMGYCKSNVQWVHKDVQQMKWDLKQTKFLEWCKVITVKNSLGS